MKNHVVVNYSLVSCMPDIRLFNGSLAECEAYVNEHSCDAVNSMRIVSSNEAKRMFHETRKTLLSCPA